MLDYFHERVDVLVIAALKKEFTELKYVFTQLWEKKTIIRRPNADYNYLRINSENEKYMNVLFTCPNKMGRVSSAIAVRDAIYHFAPRYIILVGIAASMKSSELRLGQVCCSEEVVDYELQKITEEITEDNYRLDIKKSSQNLLKLIDKMNEDAWYRKIPDQIRERHPGRFSTGAIEKVRVFSGDKVIADEANGKKLLNLVKPLSNRTIAIEMEAAGCCHSIENIPLTGASPEFIMIKGVCDYADFNKADKFQPYAALISAETLRHFLQYLVHEYGRKIDTRKQNQESGEILAAVGPSSDFEPIIEQYVAQKINLHEYAIDGTAVLIKTPHDKKGIKQTKFCGYDESMINCIPIDKFEWANYDNFSDEQLVLLKKGLIGGEEIEGWIKDRTYKPNRIRVLLNAINQPCTDNPQINLKVGNSDYFTVSTIKNLSLNEAHLNRNIHDLFPDKWTKPGEDFSFSNIPYHLSSQAIIVLDEPGTPNEYLILAANNPMRNTLEYGWNVTMAEQMQAPDQKHDFTPWWKPYTDKLGLKINEKDSRDGDKSLHGTIKRGLEEEFGLFEKDFIEGPLLLAICLEKHMYFLTSVFYVRVSMFREEFRRRWLSAPDGVETYLIAAYQIGGNKIDGSKELAKLLSRELFDCNPWLIKPPTLEEYKSMEKLKAEKEGIKVKTDEQIQKLYAKYSKYMKKNEFYFPPEKWHLSSRIRIFLAGSFRWQRDFEKYILI